MSPPNDTLVVRTLDNVIAAHENHLVLLMKGPTPAAPKYTGQVKRALEFLHALQLYQGNEFSMISETVYMACSTMEERLVCVQRNATAQNQTMFTPEFIRLLGEYTDIPRTFLWRIVLAGAMHEIGAPTGGLLQGAAMSVLAGEEEEMHSVVV